MQISQRYSHLNGEDFLKVNHQEIYDEIENVISSIRAEDYRTKKSKEKSKGMRMLFAPKALNKVFKDEFEKVGWEDTRYDYYVTTDRAMMDRIVHLPLDKQRDTLIKSGVNNPLRSYKQTDFVKDKVAIEVQFGKYSFVAYDLFVKHMLFYSGQVIDIGIEILPTRKMQTEMSSGVAYYEGEVYNVMRQGRNNPPVPLLILGVEPA